MTTLFKTPNKDFTILNLTDTQLSDAEWADGHKNRNILEYTIKTLIERTSPDLITISGDLAWAGNDYAYDMLASLLDSYKIPWAPVWGNHDNQGGAETMDKVATRYMTHEYCIYEKGPKELGNGNYVISIEENGKPVETILMLDTHDRFPYVNADGEEKMGWGKLLPNQLKWISEQTQAQKERGCTDATVVLHIPIYAYKKAIEAALKSEVDPKTISVAASDTADCWNEGYKNSIGVHHEGVGCYPADEGALEAIKATEIIHRIVAGHEHVNNWIVEHDEMLLIYALKTGAGCYWEPDLNGGTVITVNSNGVKEVHHEFVDISHLL